MRRCQTADQCMGSVRIQVNWQVLWKGRRERALREIVVFPLIVLIMLVPMGLFTGASFHSPSCPPHQWRLLQHIARRLCLRLVLSWWCSVLACAQTRDIAQGRFITLRLTCSGTAGTLAQASTAICGGSDRVTGRLSFLHTSWCGSCMPPCGLSAWFAGQEATYNIAKLTHRA